MDEGDDGWGEERFDARTGDGDDAVVFATEAAQS